MTPLIATDAEIEEMLLRQHGRKSPLTQTQPLPRAPSELPRASKTSKRQFEPYLWDNVFELNTLVRPNIDLAVWQVEEQMRLSGYIDPRGEKTEFTEACPLKYTLLANNSAGKDSIILAPFAIWCILTQVRCRVVVTSSSHLQLKQQTQKYLQTFCDDFNTVVGEKALKYVDLKITCPKTDSEIILFATDMPGKAEGWHPIEPGRWLVIILNEVKSVDESIIQAILRCYGWTHWVEVSSPGLTGTHFHRTVLNAQITYPDIPQPGQSFVRKVTDEDCPWITAANKQALIDEFGDENHPIVLSSLKAEFIAQDTVYAIPEHFFGYERPKEGLLGGHLRAGLDLSLGGDETVLSVWLGNKQIGLEVWKVRFEPTLHHLLIEAFQRYGLQAANINADAGGLGLPIIHRLEEAGWPINRIKNDEKAYRKVYKNRGTELWWTIRRLVQDKILIFLPDQKQRQQLQLRRYKITDNNVIQIEPKKEAKLRNEGSPDRADATVLAFAGLSMNDIHRLLEVIPQGRVGKYIIDPKGDVDEQIQNFIAQRYKQHRFTVKHTSPILDTMVKN